jgi:hypothetical protein
LQQHINDVVSERACLLLLALTARGGTSIMATLRAQQKEAEKNVPLEVKPEAKHDRRGILSMARWCGNQRCLQTTPVH